MAERKIEDIKKHSKVHVVIILIIALVISILPIFWILLTSFKSSIEITQTIPKWLFRPTLEHYISVLTNKGDFNFPLYFLNSLVVSISTTVLAIVIAYPAAYSIARYNTLGSNYSFFVLSIRMIPPICFLIPISILFALYGLNDKRIGIILAYLTFNIPFACWIIKSFIEDIPVELEKAALMDGYSQMQIMTKLIFPLTKSAVSAVAIICFIFSWNEFLYALVISFIRSSTLTAGAAQFVTGYGIRWGKISAAAVIAIIPTITVGLIGQKYLVRGLTMGAVK